jgi:hypothetical protein
LLSALAVATAAASAASAASAAAAGSVLSTATAAPLPTVVIMIVIVVTAAVVIVMIVIIVPATVLNNDVMPGPCRSFHCRSLSSLLSQCFLHRHCRCLRRPTATASTIDAVSVSTAAATYQPPSFQEQKKGLIKIYCSLLDLDPI